MNIKTVLKFTIVKDTLSWVPLGALLLASHVLTPLFLSLSRTVLEVLSHECL